MYNAHHSNKTTFQCLGYKKTSLSPWSLIFSERISVASLDLPFHRAIVSSPKESYILQKRLMIEFWTFWKTLAFAFISAVCECTLRAFRAWKTIVSQRNIAVESHKDLPLMNHHFSLLFESWDFWSMFSQMQKSSSRNWKITACKLSLWI